MKDDLSISVQPEPALHPASSLQRQFWLAQQQDEGGGANNIAAGFLLRGRFVPEVFVLCVREAIRRHAVLRTAYDLRDGAIWQLVRPDAALDLRQHSLPAPDDSAARKILATEAAGPFDLATGPMVRLVLVSANQADWHALALIVHHIAVDFRTKEILSAELAADYNRRIAGIPEPALPPPIPYSTFADREALWLESAPAARGLETWQKILAGRNFAPPLPLDFARPATQTFRGDLVDFTFDPELSKAITEFCRTQTTDIYVVLLAAYFALFRRYSNCGDFAVGVPLTNRRQPDLAEAVGCFVNILPLAITQLPADTFADVIRKTRRAHLEAHRIQEVPVEKIVAAVDRNRDTARSPLYQVGFTVGAPMPLALNGVECESFHCANGGAQLDLFLWYWTTPKGIAGQLRFNTALFRPSTVAKITEDLRSLVRAAIAAPNLPVDQLDFRPTVTIRNAEPTLTVAIAATFTAEVMQDALEFWFERLGWEAKPAFAPFNQIFQQLLDPVSVLRSNTRGYNVVYLRCDDLAEGSVAQTAAPAGSVSRSQRLRANLGELVAALRANAPLLHVPLCVVLCPSSLQLCAEIPEEPKLRADLAAALEAIPGIQILTPEILARWYPVADLHEPNGDELGHIPYTPRFLTALATGTVRTLHANNRKPIKALALDCDGTLWQGVVGEDGAAGVIIGPHQRDFQEFLLAQHRAGVVLCLCSKNRDADVWAVFDENPSMVLRREHIGFSRINWQPKSTNLRELAAEINIGTDTFAFIDDNILEREEVRANCPEALCPELPAAWEERLPYLRQCWPLDRTRVTQDDQKRAAHYRAEQLRTDLQQKVSSFAEFLDHLQLTVEIHPAQPDDHDRLAQLTIRTNQFNSTVRRLTVADVAHYLAQPRQNAWVVKVRDRFGDYGTVGAMLVSANEEVLRVEVLLLSCRALGRGVEHRMAAFLAAHATANGCTFIEFPVAVTPRNDPARTFLAEITRRCGGITAQNGTLRVETGRLDGFAFAPVENANKPETQAPVEKVEDSGTKPAGQAWDQRVLQIALELSNAEMIGGALARWRTQRQSAARPIQRTATTDGQRTEREQLITAAWKKILALPEIGTNENFFEVGGTSLLAAQLALELRRHGFTVRIVDLFHFPTIATLARNLNEEQAPTPKMPPPNPTETSPPTSVSGRQLPAGYERLRRFRGK